MSNRFSTKALSSSKEKQQNPKRVSSLNSPLESHWHLPEKDKKKSSLSKMSFKSIQESLTTIRSNTFKGIFQSIHDPKEEEVVESIRNQLLSEGRLPEKYDDYHTLLRFLRMRAFNVPKAKEMFLNMVKWREDFGVDAIVKDFKFEEVEAVKRCYPQGFHGVDRYGRPLYIERIGLVDLNSLLNATSIERYIKYHISEQEKTLNLRYPACSLAAKKHIASTTSVLDVKGVGLNNFSKPARELFIQIQKIDSNYYPETLNQLFIINAGSGFRALWRVLRAFLEARTLSKIKVLGTNYHSILFEAIEPRNIPEFLGGTCTCSANGGCLMQDKGPWTNPDINHVLEEVFNKGKKFMEERINKETGVDESSDKNNEVFNKGKKFMEERINKETGVDESSDKNNEVFNKGKKFMEERINKETGVDESSNKLPDIKHLLEELFNKEKKFMEEWINKETGVDESSDKNNKLTSRHFNPNGEKTLKITEEEYETKGRDRGISLKINELESWLKDTDEILQKLLLKQEEISTLVEDLKKLTKQEAM